MSTGENYARISYRNFLLRDSTFGAIIIDVLSAGEKPRRESAVGRLVDAGQYGQGKETKET